MQTIVSQNAIQDFDIPAENIRLVRLVLKPTVTIAITVDLLPEGKHFQASISLLRYDEDGDVIDTLSIPFNRLLDSVNVSEHMLATISEMLKGDFIAGIERAVAQSLIKSTRNINLMYDYTTRRLECILWSGTDTLEFSVHFDEEVQRYVGLEEDVRLFPS
jgi:hypothetical protein